MLPFTIFLVLLLVPNGVHQHWKVKFAWGGDISGQNVCRDADEGFPLMDVINAAGPYDFFLNVGDAIYGQ